MSSIEITSCKPASSSPCSGLGGMDSVRSSASSKHLVLLRPSVLTAVAVREPTIRPPRRQKDLNA
eukprot:4310129-Amphidinium_carterae.1